MFILSPTKLHIPLSNLTRDGKDKRNLEIQKASGHSTIPLDQETFTVYVRDRLPDDQDPQEVNKIFGAASAELAARCENLERPKWLTKEAKAINISLESFPNKAQSE